jgi:hypothetical protein
MLVQLCPWGQHITEADSVLLRVRQLESVGQHQSEGKLAAQLLTRPVTPPQVDVALSRPKRFAAESRAADLVIDTQRVTATSALVLIMCMLDG